METNPYSAPSAALGAGTRRARETGNENYYKTARAHLVLGCFAVFGLSGLLMMAFTETQWPAAVVPAIVLMGVLTAGHFLIWHGAKQRSNAARIGSLVIGFLSLPAFPIGTLIGVYLISNSWKRWLEPEVYADSATLLQGWPGATPR